MEYEVIADQSVLHVRDKVRELLLEGWVLKGDLRCTANVFPTYFQALTRGIEI